MEHERKYSKITYCVVQTNAALATELPRSALIVCVALGRFLQRLGVGKRHGDFEAKPAV